MSDYEKLVMFLLQQNYGATTKNQTPELDLKKYGFRVFSQNDEDGILLYIFSKIGTTNKCFDEFGIGEGRECNTANLSINFGWHGLLMDWDPENVKFSRYYLGRRFQLAKYAYPLLESSFSNIRIEEHMLTSDARAGVNETTKKK